MRNFLQILFLKRKKAYQKTFHIDNAEARIVLADLRKFCRGTGSKWMGDSEKTLVMIGRNEVWERINSYINIPDSDLAKIVETLDE